MVTNPATEESSKSIISEFDNGSQVGQRERALWSHKDRCE